MPDLLETELLPVDATAPAGFVRDLLDMTEINGWGQLTPREQKFARGIVSGLSQRGAALAAGCIGENAVVDVLACRLAAKATVRMVIAQSLHRAGSDLADTVQKLTRAQQRAFFEWENSVTREDRAEAWRVLKESSALLIGLHARSELKITGTIGHAHLHANAGQNAPPIAIPAEALPIFAQIRRAVIAERSKESVTVAV